MDNVQATALDRAKARLSSAASSPRVDYLPPGLYHYHRQQADEHSRIHLRVEPDQNGLLLVNASRVIHLNPTATYMAYLTLEEMPAQQVVDRLTQAYQLSAPQASLDYTQFVSDLDELLRPDGACPIHELGASACVYVWAAG